jgi:hypothetical protein
LRLIVLACMSLPLLFTVRPALADAPLDQLARDVDRVESIRAVKDLQATYAQYSQAGLWNEAGALFSGTGNFVFDGLIQPAQTMKGPRSIAEFLRNRYGGGHEGMQRDGLSTPFIDAPVVNLSVDGATATARWQSIIFHGHGGKARIEGGVFVARYAREKAVWSIAELHYYPQYDGAYEDGWVNWGGGDIPVAPYHFDTRGAGIPIPPASGAAPATRATLASLQKRVDALNDIDRVRNLQSAYGYYADRRMWDDVADLFSADAVVEVPGEGSWRGHQGVRKWLQSLGPAGLSHGQLNDRGQNDVVVTVAAGGQEAFARGFELGMLGEADQEKGWWEVAVFHNRFVKEGGIWKIREMRRHVLMKTDVFQGWGKNRMESVPGISIPPFLTDHPVTGRVVKVAGETRVVGMRPLTGRIAARSPVAVPLEEVRRRLARSAAYDGITNISAAYGYYVDDSNAAGWANTLAAMGYKETPFQGYHIGRDRLIAARVRGPGPAKQAGISYHWLLQPMVLVSEDGRSATGRFRLFQPRTGKTVGKTGDFLAAMFWGGMYHDRYVLEDGAWKIWELTLDEPYITPVSWKEGVWAKSKDPAPRPAGSAPRAPSNSTNVDITLVQIGRREEHFSGGPGETLQWPSIMPMWFTYTNPVSGRVPPLHQPDCVPCSLRPDLALSANGYQEPPDAPAANRSP